MKTEQHKQAEHLYFNTNLSKTEIADAVGVSRRTIHYWVSHNHWDSIRQAGQAMPTILAGNCYVMLAQLQNSILSRTDAPITAQEVNTIVKLTNTITKLNARAVLCENLEALTHFLEFTQHHFPTLSAHLQPIVSAYVSHSAAAVQPLSVPPPPPAPSAEERRLDEEDEAAITAKQREAATPQSPSVPPPAKPAPTTIHQKPGAMPPPAPHLNRAARRAMARAAA